MLLLPSSKWQSVMRDLQRGHVWIPALARRLKQGSQKECSHGWRLCGRWSNSQHMGHNNSTIASWAPSSSALPSWAPSSWAPSFWAPLSSAPSSWAPSSSALPSWAPSFSSFYNIFIIIIIPILWDLIVISGNTFCFRVCSHANAGSAGFYICIYKKTSCIDGSCLQQF